MKGTILGAIIGDTIGSIYEFDNTKDYNFNLLSQKMEFTDDTVMTIAVADWLLKDKTHSSSGLCKIMREWGQKYRWPMGSYGGRFSEWLDNPHLGPYNSWGNGAAMRVAPVGFAFDNIDEVMNIAKRTAEVTHNHHEGIKGAQATATAIFLAKTCTKEEIRSAITQQFGYDLSMTCDGIRPSYHFDESCQRTVPQSLIAFLDSNNFEDAIRLSVSLGGDADTIGAITGAVAAAYYKEIPDNMASFVVSKLSPDIRAIWEAFETKFAE